MCSSPNVLLLQIQSISNTHRDSIFYQASLPKRVWECAIKVIDCYEEGKLKGQKLNLSSLLSKPEFKQQYLAPIRALEENDQCLLLERVIKNEISLAELKEECSKLKQLHGLRLAFVRLTNSDSWEDAQEKLPQFAKDEQLLKFIHIDIKKAIPKSFSDFCLRAKNSSQAESVCSAYTTAFNTVSARVLQAKFTEITGTKIKSEDPSFTGANLILTTFEEVF